MPVGKHSGEPFEAATGSSDAIGLLLCALFDAQACAAWQDGVRNAKC